MNFASTELHLHLGAHTTFNTIIQRNSQLISKGKIKRGKKKKKAGLREDW